MAGRGRSNNGEGWLTRAAVEAAGITEEITEAAGKLAWRLRIRFWDRPGHGPGEATPPFGRWRETNEFAKKAMTAWNAIVEMFAAGRDATGNIYCGGIDRDQDGGDIIGGRLLNRKNIHVGWHLPTLILDATMRWNWSGPISGGQRYPISTGWW